MILTCKDQTKKPSRITPRKRDKLSKIQQHPRFQLRCLLGLPKSLQRRSTSGLSSITILSFTNDYISDYIPDTRLHNKERLTILEQNNVLFAWWNSKKIQCHPRGLKSTKRYHAVHLRLLLLLCIRQHEKLQSRTSKIGKYRRVFLIGKIRKVTPFPLTKGWLLMGEDFNRYRPFCILSIRCLSNFNILKKVFIRGKTLFYL